MNDLELTGKAVDKLNLVKADKSTTYTKTEIDNNFKTKEKVAKRILTLNDVEGDKSKLSEFGGVLSRQGNIVIFSGRIKPNTPLNTGGVNNTGSYEIFKNIPVGYRLSQDYTFTSWNVALAVSKFWKSGEWNGSCIAERVEDEIGVCNRLLFFCDTTGNHYITGQWFTDNPFPS